MSQADLYEVPAAALPDIGDVLRDPERWTLAGEAQLRARGFWPNRVAWGVDSVVGVALSGNDGDYAVNRELLRRLADAERTGRHR
jgi:hypothetical protein